LSPINENSFNEREFLMTIISGIDGHYDYSHRAPKDLTVPMILFIVLPKTAATGS
jgi:hypothetical protein